MPNFEKIRQQLKAVIAEHGGKMEINEWNGADGETMKVVMTFKAVTLDTQTVDMVRTAASYASHSTFNLVK